MTATNTVINTIESDALTTLTDSISGAVLLRATTYTIPSDEFTMV
jgi:hypothetical protein